MRQRSAAQSRRSIVSAPPPIRRTTTIRSRNCFRINSSAPIWSSSARPIWFPMTISPRSRRWSRARREPARRSCAASASGLSPEVLLGLVGRQRGQHGRPREPPRARRRGARPRRFRQSRRRPRGGRHRLDDLKARVAKALALPGVLRVKGRVAVAGKAALAVVQAVGPRIETWFAPGTQPSGLVVIGLKDIDQAAISAIASGPVMHLLAGEHGADRRRRRGRRPRSVAGRHRHPVGGRQRVGRAGGGGSVGARATTTHPLRQSRPPVPSAFGRSLCREDAVRRAAGGRSR